MTEYHLHNGTDSPKINIKEAVEFAPQTAVTGTSKTAGGTYTSNEQVMLNEIKATQADIITKLKALGLTL